MCHLQKSCKEVRSLPPSAGGCCLAPARLLLAHTVEKRRLPTALDHRTPQEHIFVWPHSRAAPTCPLLPAHPWGTPALPGCTAAGARPPSLSSSPHPALQHGSHQTVVVDYYSIPDTIHEELLSANQMDAACTVCLQRCLPGMTAPVPKRKLLQAALI